MDDDRKSVFVSFAKKDTRQRNLLKEHPLLNSPAYDLVDFSVKDARNAGWRDRVQLSVRRSSGVIVLVSENSLESLGQKWEIGCARSEKKEILGVWAYSNDRTQLPGVITIPWSWDSIKSFIDSL